MNAVIKPRNLANLNYKICAHAMDKKHKDENRHIANWYLLYVEEPVKILYKRARIYVHAYQRQKLVCLVDYTFQFKLSWSNPRVIKTVT